MTLTGCQEETIIITPKPDIEVIDVEITASVIKASPMEFENGTEVTLSMQCNLTDLGGNPTVIYMVDEKDVAQSQDKDNDYKAVFVPQGLTEGKHVISAKIKTLRNDRDTYIKITGNECNVTVKSPSGDLLGNPDSIKVMNDLYCYLYKEVDGKNSAIYDGVHIVNGRIEGQQKYIDYTADKLDLIGWSDCNENKHEISLQSEPLGLLVKGIEADEARLVYISPLRVLEPGDYHLLATVGLSSMFRFYSLHTLLGDETLASVEQKENGDYVVVFK